MKTQRVLCTCLVVLLLLALCFSTVAFAKKAAKECESYETVSYKKLASPTFVDDYNGKCVSVKGKFLGEWTIVSNFKKLGITTKNQVFVNHGNYSGQASANVPAGMEAFASMAEGMAFPDFVLSAAKEKSNFIFEWDKGQLFEAKGRAKKVSYPGKYTVHIIIDDIKKIEADK